MTTDQQRETARHLYRLAWRFPERAPEPNDAQGYDEYGTDVYTPYYVKAGVIFVEASVHGANYARVVVHAGSHRKMSIEGTPCYVEGVLRVIPCSMRLHTESADGGC